MPKAFNSFISFWEIAETILDIRNNLINFLYQSHVLITILTGTYSFRMKIA